MKNSDNEKDYSNFIIISTPTNINDSGKFFYEIYNNSNNSSDQEFKIKDDKLKNKWETI